MLNTEQVIGLYQSMSELSGRMLDAARSRDWENLAALETDCARKVQLLKDGEGAAPLSGDWRAKKVRIIHQILAHDREIRNLTEPWMAELAALIGSTGTERKLAAAYGAARAS